MKANTPELMKFKKLQRKLGESRRGTIGLLEGLWIEVARNSPAGDVGRFTNEEIAIMVDWDGDPDLLVEALFNESGWTQQQIADKEGKSQFWVSKRLLFGRFIKHFIAAAIKPPVNLTERRFRELWSIHGGNVTANTPAESKKFQAIIESDDWEMAFATKPPFPTNDKIKEFCTDNRYRTALEIAEEIGHPDDEPEQNIRWAIGRIKATHSGHLLVQEKTFAGGVAKYKFKNITNDNSLKVRAITVTEELAPIVEELNRCLNQKVPHDAVDLAKAQLRRLNDLVKKYC